MKFFLCIAVALVVTVPALAHADIAKKCVAPLVFVPGEGCAKPPAPKATAADPYYKGLAIAESDPKKAFALFEESCKKKHGPACTQIGIIYAFGRDRVVARDQAKANTHWEKACELGDGAGCQRRGNAASNANDYPLAKKYFERGCERRDGTACAQLAFFIDRGHFGKADPAAAKPIYAKAHKILAQTCTPKNGFACMVRGYLHERGYGVPVDVPLAIKAYEQACTAGNGDACYALVPHYEKAKQPDAKITTTLEKACIYDRAEACSSVARRLTVADPKSTRAVELAERGCQLDTKQCSILADLYRLGRGTKEDQTKATALFKSICETGDHSICVTYARRLREGVGTKADSVKSLSLLEESCKADDADGCEYLSLYLSQDKTDDARAFKMAVKGCGLKSGHSCFLAGWMIRATRRGDPSQSPEESGKEALPHFEKGCEYGSPKACNSAGDLHSAGTGTPKDPKKAVDAYTKGCDAEYPSGDACVSLAIIAYNGEPPVEKDRKKAIRAAARGCVNEQTHACRWLPSSAAEPDLVQVAITELAPACGRGVEDVCHWQAQVQLRGDRETKQKGLALLASTCGKKNGASCARHAEAIYFGHAGEENKQQGEALFKRYCDEDRHADACSQLAGIYSQDKKDHVAALRYADAACTLKHADGCTQAGYQHYTAQPGVEWRIDKAVEYYAKSCELGSAVGCGNHAELLRYGIYAKADHKKAYELYQKSCDLGSAYGCTGAAWYIASGQGGAKQDKKLALTLYKKGCDDENSEACVELAALMEQEKQGSAAEIERLRQRGFALAVKHAPDNPMHRYFLGLYHRDGMATVKNPAKALEWFEKACEGYDPLGCIAAAQALAKSSNEGDIEKARAYFKRACAAGIDDGCTGAKTVAVAPRTAGGTDAKGPPAVAKGKGCACGGQIAPGAEGALLLLALASLFVRRRRS